MKKLFLVLVILTLTFTNAFANGQPEVPSYKVDFVDGENVLKTVMVEENGLLNEVDDVKVDGKTFTEWYATPSLTHKFDFSKPITKDTLVFGGFITYLKDDRDFYLVGSGSSPDLKLSNWGNGTNKQLTKEHTESENIYTLTTDLYQGDEFQFAMNGLWHSKRGNGYLMNKGTSFMGGGGIGDTSDKATNIKVKEDGNYTFKLYTYPAEDYYAENMSDYKADDPEPFKHNNYDRIEWTRNGDILVAKPVAYNVYYIKGSKVSNWQDVYTSDLKFTKGQGENSHIHTLSKYLVAGDEFMFTSRVVEDNKESSNAGTAYIKKDAIKAGETAIIGAVHEKNMNILTTLSGMYTFTYNEEDYSLSATCDESYTLPRTDVYIGGLESPTKEESNAWAILNSEKQFSYDGTLYVLDSIKLNKDSQFTIQIVTEGAKSVIWGGDNNTNIASYNYLKIGKTEPAINSWNNEKNPKVNDNGDFVAADLTGEWPNNNFKPLKDGTYKVTYDPISNLVNFYNLDK